MHSIRCQQFIFRNAEQLAQYIEGRVGQQLIGADDLQHWVEHARADRTNGKTGLTSAEREELVRLRKELRIVQEEREILKKAAAFFAKQSR